jgi:hypothetical protein
VTNKSGRTTFSFGVVFGSIGGFVLGVFLGRYVFALATMLVGTVTRKQSSEKQRPKFEWLLQ